MPEQEFANNQESGIRPPNNKTQLWRFRLSNSMKRETLI